MKKVLFCIVLFALLFSQSGHGQQVPNDDTIIAGLMRQVVALQNQVSSLQQGLKQLTTEIEELKKKCGDRCEEKKP